MKGINNVILSSGKRSCFQETLSKHLDVDQNYRGASLQRKFPDIVNHKHAGTNYSQSATKIFPLPDRTWNPCFVQRGATSPLATGVACYKQDGNCYN